MLALRSTSTKRYLVEIVQLNLPCKMHYGLRPEHSMQVHQSCSDIVLVVMVLQLRLADWCATSSSLDDAQNHFCPCLAIGAADLGACDLLPVVCGVGP